MAMSWLPGIGTMGGRRRQWRRAARRWWARDVRRRDRGRGRGHAGVRAVVDHVAQLVVHHAAQVEAGMRAGGDRLRPHQPEPMTATTTTDGHAGQHDAGATATAAAGPCVGDGHRPVDGRARSRSPSLGLGGRVATPGGSHRPTDPLRTGISTNRYDSSAATSVRPEPDGQQAPARRRTRRGRAGSPRRSASARGRCRRSGARSRPGGPTTAARAERVTAGCTRARIRPTVTRSSSTNPPR